MSIFIFFLIVSSSISCKDKIKQVLKEKKEFNLSYSLKKSDSFNINSINLFFEGAKDKNLLFYNGSNYDIFVYDFSNKNIKSFNKAGDNYESYNFLYPGTVRILNDSTVGVGLNKKIKTYSLDGDFYEEYSFSEASPTTPLRNFNYYNDSTLIAFRASQNNFQVNSFLDSKHDLFVIKNLKSQIESLFGQHPIKGSDFLNGTHYYPYPYDNFEILDIEKKEIRLVNSNDQNVFIFDIENKKLKKTQKLELENYLEVPIKFNSKISRDEGLINIYSTGIITGYNYFKKSGMEIINYCNGLPRDFVIDFAKKNKDEFPRYKRPEFNYSLHFLKNGKQISNDLKIPKEYGKPIYTIDESTIIFQKRSNEDDESANQTWFYICNLSPNTILNDK